MLQAIQTKYIGPRNVRGSRIVAWCDARRIVRGYDDSKNAGDNHTQVAAELAHSLDWDGSWHGGGLPSGGYCFVQVDRHHPDAAFTVIRSFAKATA